MNILQRTKEARSSLVSVDQKFLGKKSQSWRGLSTLEILRRNNFEVNHWQAGAPVRPNLSKSKLKVKKTEKRSIVMKLELLSASNFLVHLIRLAKRNVTESQLGKFRESLIEVLRRRYRDHWFPEKPFKGSGYRCIRINGKMDPVIAQAGDSCGLSAAFLHSTFPSELTMWIDPLEVSYRIGENGSICVLYEYCEGVTEPWIPASLRNNKNSKPAEPKPEPPPPATPAAPTCKDSLRMDYLLDPKKSVSIEQLAALVSS